MVEFTIHDGGRSRAGYRGHAGDCVTRAIAIASGRPYAEIYEALSYHQRNQRTPKRGGRSVSARNGVHTHRKWFRDYMAKLGFRWVPTMGIGTGTTVHLKASELPMGRLVVSLSKHYAAVIDGRLYDTHDCSRGGTRAVYGYWIKET